MRVEREIRMDGSWWGGITAGRGREGVRSREEGKAKENRRRRKGWMEGEGDKGRVGWRGEGDKSMQLYTLTAHTVHV